MKRILLLLCFMSAVTAFSQNTDPQPLQNINWNDTVFTSPTQTKFALGWQWAGPAKAVNQRLRANFLNEKTFLNSAFKKSKSIIHGSF